MVSFPEVSESDEIWVHMLLQREEYNSSSVYSGEDAPVRVLPSQRNTESLAKGKTASCSILIVTTACIYITFAISYDDK